MVDLHRQYLRLKPEIDQAMQNVIDSCSFINGPQVRSFSSHLSEYLDVPHVIPCGNGTDALQIALMSLNLMPGDEVIVPAFTYVAAAEVIALLGLIPVWVDVEEDTFNINPYQIEAAISPKTKALIVVHLFGQSCPMEIIRQIAEQNHLYVIEDNAQSLGAECIYTDGQRRKTGTIGHIGTTSFFPSKPLACYGDGGAVITSDDRLAERIRMIANHGQIKKYHHKIIGCNSRLDTLQAAVLEAKLPHINEFAEARQRVAQAYDEALGNDPRWEIPQRTTYSTHVFHQYTLRIKDGKRDALQSYLKEHDIPSMVYYPLPLHRQEAFYGLARNGSVLPHAENLTQAVLSLPIHSEMTEEEIGYIIETIKHFES
ncbi:MAG TPA: DegT/DnrJ/EryC1/StrS family aminotransferase [Candidatus Parabacteroides intestinavium]|nr:DegT/DnrJ/EryC1/StrS family aminotransferase [Candidatus Parabacteroides intestinavium]